MIVQCSSVVMVVVVVVVVVSLSLPRHSCDGKHYAPLGNQGHRLPLVSGADFV
jgi:hypothetical protein